MLLFNWVGYRLFSSYMENKANSTLEAQLDENNYDEAQLISIKVPASNIPYFSNSDRFERVNGQIELGGVQYKYVKRRLFNDSLELMCIPNQTAMKIQVAKDEFFKLVNDLQHNGQEKKSGSHPVKGFSTDTYTTSGQNFDLAALGFCSKAAMCSPYSFRIPTCFSPTAEQPPDLS